MLYFYCSRRFFSDYIETDKLHCFHFRHRPERKTNLPAQQTPAGTTSSSTRPLEATLSSDKPLEAASSSAEPSETTSCPAGRLEAASSSAESLEAASSSAGRLEAASSSAESLEATSSSSTTVPAYTTSSPTVPVVPPVHQDVPPVHQDLHPVHPDVPPVHQDVPSITPSFSKVVTARVHRSRDEETAAAAATRPTCCCVVQLPSQYIDSFVKRFHRKHWLDSTESEMQSQCFVAKLGRSEQRYIYNREHIHQFRENKKHFNIENHVSSFLCVMFSYLFTIGR